MSVVELVERERARVRARVVGAGAAAAVAGAAVVAAAGAWALAGARWLALPRALPALVWVVAVAAVVLAVVWTRRRLGRDASRTRVAAAIERERSLRDGQLRGALEAADSGPLGRLAAGQLARQLAPDGAARTAPALAPALRRATGARMAVGAGAAAAALALVAVSAGTSADGFAAVLHPADAWRGTLLPPIRFAGAPGAIVRGERLRLQVDAPGRRTITVTHRQTGRAWRRTQVPVNAAGRAVVDVGAIDADLALAATDGRATSDTARVHVTDRAFVGDVSLRAEYPDYLGRSPEDLPTGEAVRVPRGTALVVRGRASTALDAVSLGDAARRVALAVEGHQFSGRLIAESSGRWAWSAAGPGGPVQDVPTPLEIEVLPDSLPQVEITRPSADSVVDGLAPVKVSLAASDDHGLAGVALRVWKERADGQREPADESRLASGVPAWSGEATVDLAQRGLQAGDRVSVQAVAVDASPWRQGATSRVLVLRVPSASEMRERARDAADSAVAKAIAAAAASKDLQQRTSEAARSRDASKSGSQQGGGSSGDKGSMSYDAAEKAKSLAQQQRQLQQQVQALQDEAKSLERQLKQAGALDTSLARQMQDVQKLLRDALTPELAEQLRNLEQSANNLQSGEARQALEQLAAQQRALREQLERSVEMLKRAALEGSMQTLRDEAKELAQAERKEADRLQGKQEPPQNAQPNAQQQNGQQQGDQRTDPQHTKELADRSRDLSKEIDELQKRLKNERADFGAQKVGEAGDHAEASAEQMQRAAQQQAGQKQGAEQRGQQGAPQNAQQQGAQQQGAQQAGAQQMGAQRQGAQQQAGAQQGGQQQGGPQQGSQQGQQGADAARRAADEMQRAADQLASARQGQIEQWKSELSGELDQAIQETMQMAREQSSIEQRTRAGQDPASLRGEQAAVQQGVEQTAQRLDQAGKKSSLLSQRAQRAMNDAKQQVAQASQALQQQSGQQGQQQSGQNGAADSMKEATEALNRAAASLVRDRERVNGAQSASGFSEMLEQLKQLAQQQGQINQQAQGLPIPIPGAAGQGARDASRQLARQQRSVAEKLEDVGDNDPSGKADALAREARQLAQALERQGADPATVNRQQQLYRRLLDAGRTMEQDERDESGKREARAGGNIPGTAPVDGPQSGKAATKFAVPSWADLRGLSPEERRIVIEYFRRLNSDKP